MKDENIFHVQVTFIKINLIPNNIANKALNPPKRDPSTPSLRTSIVVSVFTWDWQRTDIEMYFLFLPSISEMDGFSEIEERKAGRFRTISIVLITGGREVLFFCIYPICGMDGRWDSGEEGDCGGLMLRFIGSVMAVMGFVLQERKKKCFKYWS